MLNRAEINLNNLRYNAKEIKKLVGDTKFCAVVKADAYGHGASEVANELHSIVDSFAVALVEEGVSLRLSGVKKDILVLIPPFKEDLERAVRHKLTLTIAELNGAKSINREAKSQGVKVKVHIKVNTGMNRQGVDSIEELDKICSYISSSKNLILDGVYSHFARPENKKSRNSQVDKFLLAINCVKGYNNKVITHISASGGLLAGVKLDMVRVGIMLYGYTPYPTDKIRLKPIMKITAPVLKTRTLESCDTALYGDKKVRCAGDYSLIRYGYADGLARRGGLFQHGNRCMDLTLVKSNGNKNFVVLDDANILAKEYKTISYEILCSAPVRAERRYRR